MPIEESLRLRFQEAGLSRSIVDAAWPRWWTEDAEGSASAVAELRFALARQLGMAPSSLADGNELRFLWYNETRYKNRGDVTEREAAILASFAVSIGRCALSATSQPPQTLPRSALDLRAFLLSQYEVITLRERVVACWGLGVPVLHLNTFPLRQKRMHAVTARLDDRFAVLIAQDSTFPSRVAFWLAHELGHIAGQHLDDAAALVDVEDPLQITDTDIEERSADAYALELLTGSASPVVEASTQAYTAAEVARAVERRAEILRVDPGILALCLGHADNTWAQAFGALKIIGQADVSEFVNHVAEEQLDWDNLTLDAQGFLRTVMGLDRE